MIRAMCASENIGASRFGRLISQFTVDVNSEEIYAAQNLEYIQETEKSVQTYF